MIQLQADPIEPEIVNYVPGEIAVVVRFDGVDDGGAFYEAVRGRLNQRLLELLRAAPDQPESPRTRPLELDLMPTLLARRFGPRSTPLQPLQRPSKTDSPREFQPWLTFHRPEQGQTTWHLYFQLGPKRASLRGDYDEARQLVRELVLLFNRHLPGMPVDTFRDRPWSVAAVTPNWLIAAAPFSCGSPAGLPIPATPKKQPRFDFVDTEVVAALDCADGPEVVVAVLDTCPRQDVLDDAAKKNALLGEVDGKIKMNVPALLPDSAFAHLSGCLPRLQWNMQGLASSPPRHFNIADHGLFAAGIVFDITRKCNVRVFLSRVLNDYGMGDLFAISQALMALPTAIDQLDPPGPRGRRLVINLSLGADVPIPSRLLERWLPRTAADPASLSSNLPAVCQVLDSLHSNISDVMTWLADRGVLVVAAAGNDALRPDVVGGPPPPPRFPARYDDVLGVAAMRRDLVNPANYSNRGDVVLQSGSGHIATFGGNVDPHGETEPATTSEDDSIVGIVASSSTGGKRNRTGWAKWSGTSFSTPIIAAAAARLWSANPALTPRQVAARLRELGRDPHSGSDPDSPLEVPVLRVTQS